MAVQTTRVALFPTCLTDTLFPDTARAVLRLLERLGCTVELPMDATCCGQLHYNTGYRDHAVPRHWTFDEPQPAQRDGLADLVTRLAEQGQRLPVAIDGHGVSPQPLVDNAEVISVRASPLQSPTWR